MTIVTKQSEFVGEVYWDGNAFVGIWSGREGAREIEHDVVRSVSHDSARWHIAVAANERGFDWDS
jgi:hypothetical protein